MKGLDDHEDGLNDAAFERALGGRKRAASRCKPSPVAKQPTLADLERAHRAAFAYENKLVNALPENAPAVQTAAAWRAAEATNAALRAVQTAAAWRAAEATNAALRAVQAHPDYPNRVTP